LSGRDHTPSQVPQRWGTNSCREAVPLACYSYSAPVDVPHEQRARRVLAQRVFGGASVHRRARPQRRALLPRGDQQASTWRVQANTVSSPSLSPTLQGSGPPVGGPLWRRNVRKVAQSLRRWLSVHATVEQLSGWIVEGAWKMCLMERSADQRAGSPSPLSQKSSHSPLARASRSSSKPKMSSSAPPPYG
jgi:hypothetical protein